MVCLIINTNKADKILSMKTVNNCYVHHVLLPHHEWFTRRFLIVQLTSQMISSLGSQTVSSKVCNLLKDSWEHFWECQNQDYLIHHLLTWLRLDPFKIGPLRSSCHVFTQEVAKCHCWAWASTKAFQPLWLGCWERHGTTKMDWDGWLVDIYNHVLLIQVLIHPFLRCNMM